MNQKEINELRRRFRPEKSAISRVYGCYVNSSKEIVSDLDESLGMMPQEESEKYLSLLKKGLSGSLGKNLIDIVFSTQQVVDSEEHRLLTTLRDSQLKDNEARQTFYHKVIDSLDMGDSSYLLLLTCDSYDVPHRGKDDSLQADASDEVFTYIVCVVCPIKEGKVELGYFPGDNEFHCAAGQTVAPPELGFLFPAFDDRAANIYNALFYSRKANEIHQEFIDAIFHVEAPMSAVEQKEAFQSALSDAFDCSLEVMQTVHEQLREKIKEHRESRSSEPLEMSASEIGQILQSCGIADEQVAAFQENCGEQFGSGVVLNPANLIDSSRFEIKTPEITISADPEYSYLVETQIKKNYGAEGAEVIVDNCQVNLYGGFAPASQTAVELSKALGSRTVMSGSISRGKNDPSQSLQMIERPLMTPDELKSMPKGSFIVAKTGVHPMKVKLRLFLDWGIRFGEPYEVPEKAQRAVAYADKQELEESIIRRHYGTVAEEEPPQDVPAAVGGMNHGMQAEKNSRKTILRP